MDNDERDRRDEPERDAAADDQLSPDEEQSAPAEPSASDEPPAPEPVAPDEPVAAVEPSAPEEASVSASEIESWPSQDAAADVTASQPTEVPPVDSSTVEAWPTEPPVAGSGGPDTWPTTPPEMGGEPILEPEAASPPPSEVEAYAAPVAAAAGEPSAAEPVAEPDRPYAPAAAAAGAAAVEPLPVTPEPAADEGIEGEAVAAGAAVASAGTAESTLCPRCGTENQPGLSFCRSCGQRLVAAGVATTVDRPVAPEGTQACPRCGTHNRAGVAFCQNCGANLRGTSAGYVPPAVAGAATATADASARSGAVLGPVVLIIGIVGLVTGYLLPFAYGTGSLYERAFGADGYGVAFWTAYPEGAGLADAAYFGLAAGVPILAVLLLGLAIGGFMRARPGPIQTVGLVIALVWSVGLAVLFVVVELIGGWDGDIVGLLRVLTPAGIILFLASLIIVIGTLTRFGRS